MWEKNLRWAGDVEEGGPEQVLIRRNCLPSLRQLSPPGMIGIAVNGLIQTLAVHLKRLRVGLPSEVSKNGSIGLAL